MQAIDPTGQLAAIGRSYAQALTPAVRASPFMTVTCSQTELCITYVHREALSIPPNLPGSRRVLTPGIPLVVMLL